ncbi:MAG: type II/IV secretion system ATPase subunit [Nitrososphaerota archaeon]|nr:type II/IV secretion system ATPase subunit [Nitrososphaerota archaeon]
MEPRPWTSRLSALARLSRGRGAARFPEGRGLQPIPFEPPHGGRLVENYVVEYELRSAGGAPYRSSFAVYVYDDRGRGLYLVKEPYLRPEVAATVSEGIESLSTWLAPSPVISVDPLGYLFAELRRAGYLEDGAPDQKEEAKAVTHYLMREMLGYSLVDPLLRDPQLEDVSCEGPGRPVKVWHKRHNSHGWLESNVVLGTDQLDAGVARLVQRSGRSVSVSSPVVDCVLPEGYRLAATWGKEVTSLGSSFSIRKLRASPYTISELVRAGTMDAALAAHLWLLLELKGLVVIAGVTASGKTTLLNALATVLNPSWKVISIEDTREITLPQGGWKPLHTRYSNRGAAADVTLFDLVKLSLRERPDFVILGESRGEEVQALFQAAAAGTGCLTTFHASNPEGLEARLTQPPLSVARSSLGLIDAAVFMVREQGGARFVQSVFEPLETDPRGWRCLFSRGGEAKGEGSASLGRRGAGFGYSAKRISAELERRASFLESLVGRGVADYGSLAVELRGLYSRPGPA